MSQFKAITFSIQDLEKDYAQRNFGQLESRIIELLTYLDNNGNVESKAEIRQGVTHIMSRGIMPIHSAMRFEEKAGWSTRLAVVISAYLSDNKVTHSDKFLVHLVLYKTLLSNLFYITPFKNLDHILFNRGLMDDKKSLNLKDDQDIKYLLSCHCLNSEIGFDVDMLATALPTWGMYWYLGLLYGRVHSCNARIDSNLQYVVARHHLIDSFSLDHTAVEMMTNPWMLCSYWDIEGRHSIKKSMNRALEKWVKSQLPQGLLKRIEENSQRQGPIKRITVVSEVYRSIHAMYRCYHQPLVRLGEHYEVTCVTAAKAIDETAAKDFAQVIYVEEGAQHIDKTVMAVAKTNPDLILFTSIGMSKWAIPLANLRIARYQMMAYGHPASAFSDYIDYGATVALPPGPDYQVYLQEKAMPFHAPYLYVSPHPEYEPRSYDRPTDGVVRIAINSSLQKVTNRFINLCILALNHSSVPIEFHFFMIDSREFKVLAFEQSLRERLGPHFRIHGPAPYMEYMENLAKCDLALGTFPFGGSNSNADLMLLGIPKLIYNDHSDIAAFADEMFMDKLQLPAILKADSEHSLLANLVYLIHDWKTRDQIRAQILAQEPYKILFEETVGDDQDALLGPVRWIEKQALVGTETC